MGAVRWIYPDELADEGTNAFNLAGVNIPVFLKGRTSKVVAE